MKRGSFLKIGDFVVKLFKNICNEINLKRLQKIALKLCLQ